MDISAITQSLKKFEDKHLNEDCFLICNGPSLNNMDLSPLKEYTVFGLNKIYLIKDKIELKIDYHVAVNPYVVEQSFFDFAQMDNPSFLSIDALRRINNNNIEELHDKIYPILTGDLRFFFSPNPYKRIHEGYTVTYVALQLIYWMGFKNVFIIGLDHDFKCEGKPNEKQTMAHDDLSHFHPDYFKGQEWQLPDLDHSERAYFLALDYYTCNKRNIYDATINGKAYVFPRIDYQKAIDICKKKGIKGDCSSRKSTFEEKKACKRVLAAKLNENKLQEERQTSSQLRDWAERTEQLLHQERQTSSQLRDWAERTEQFLAQERDRLTLLENEIIPLRAFAKRFSWIYSLYLKLRKTF